MQLIEQLGGGRIMPRMTNSNPNPNLPMTDETDVSLGERWRSAARLIAGLVLEKLERLTDPRREDGKDLDDDAEIRTVASLVIAAQRSMEMEDRYARRSDAAARPDRRCAAGKPDDRDAAERKELERIERKLEREYAAIARSRDNGDGR